MNASNGEEDEDEKSREDVSFCEGEGEDVLEDPARVKKGHHAGVMHPREKGVDAGRVGCDFVYHGLTSW